MTGTGTYARLLLTLLFTFVLMDLHFTKVNLPEQTVQLLFVPPVAIEDQRDQAEQQ